MYDDEAAWQTWHTRLDDNHPIDEKRGWTSEPLQQGTRYTVFAVFDDICVESMHPGYPGSLLMLVRRDWEPLSDADMRALMDGDVHEDYEHGYMYNHSEGPGGWIYQDVASYTTLYHRLRDINDWSEEFRYPSQVYTSMLLLERSPAFWREERVVDQGGIVASTRVVAARS
ncbi:hypothetical protein B0T11DRAFT_292671 [Plectosphaerella cucumerina]|uniref:Uncharacterized protein n=1 Tax=Plectosphaerella cucumerina TaxID=40658 RepID=A0A8K0TRC6_9PEZI|nr:hypothetical protein B0T11DRAFT_292671 [Plectosphaerella cucumerina]